MVLASAPSVPPRLEPHVRVALEALGIPPAPRPREGAAVFRERLATELMAVFRDTRREDAFEALYRLARADVLRSVQVALRRHRAELDPRELLQDTFVNVYLYSSRFAERHASSFRVWAGAIAANAVRRALSRRGAARMLPEERGEPVDDRRGPHLELVHDEERRDMRLAWLLFLQHYAGAFAELAPRDRQALELVEVHGLSYAEAGQRLRVGRSNMKMIMFRSRQRIVARMRARMLGRPPARVAC